jgi:OOP family OmpA-OmpF porin
VPGHPQHNVTVDADGCPAVAEVVRVELDVKFDFDKSVVKPTATATSKTWLTS